MSTNRIPDHERGTVDRYLNTVGRVPLLTADEEITLARLVKRGLALSAEDRELTHAEQVAVKKGLRAQKRFVEANLRLVVYLAKKYTKRRFQSLDMLDLIQEGSVGLMRAVELFDPARGYKFSTYAYWWIRQAMSRAIDQKEWLIRRPCNVGDLAGKLAKTVTRLAQELQRQPTMQELADALETTTEELETLRHRGSGTLSLDNHVNHDSESSRLIDLIVYDTDLDQDDSDLSLDLELRRPVIQAALQHLTEQERTYILLKYGLAGDGRCWSNADLAKRSGISRERVRQILERAVRKLRFQLGRAGLNPLATRSLGEADESATEPDQTPADVLVPAPAVRLYHPPAIPEHLPLEERRVRWSAPAQRFAS
jgi:RNA polymerase sigma factor (sigma-70 family)